MVQKILNPREKASTNSHLILSMAIRIGYKKRVPLQSGLIKNMEIGKLGLKKTLVPAHVVFTATLMSMSHKMPQSGTIGPVGTKDGSNLMKLWFMQVLIHKESYLIDENLTRTKLQLSARQN